MSFSFFLIESGADLDFKDSHGRTAFDQIASCRTVGPEDDRVLRELLTGKSK